MEQEEIKNTEKVLEEKEVKKRHHKTDNKKEKLLEEKLMLLNEALVNEQEKTLRLNAELQNIQRHREEDIQRLLKYEGEELIKSLLPIIDNFERALSLENEDNKQFLDGFKMIYRKLVEILDNKQVKIINETNIEFDPSIHQAVATDTVEGVKPNQVLEVLQKGYIYKDKLLRPAMVKVSQ